MTHTMPLEQMLAAPQRRDRRIGVIAVVSAAAHLLLIGLLLLPAFRPLQQPEPPAPINVELVPPSEAPSVPPPPSAEPSSSEPPPSSAPPSSAQPSMEPASSGESEPASSAEAASAASSAPASGTSEEASASASA